MKRTAVLVAAAFLAAGCSGTTGGTPSPASSGSTSVAEEPHRLAFDVSGTAVVTTLTCTVDGKTTEEKNVKLPWSRTFSFPAHTGKHEYQVVMQYSDGSVNATAKVDGRLQTSSSGGGDGAGTQSMNGDFTD
ncbi:hypothetical protein ACIOD2_12585 [Amycolatopsis sp. NPDC088138]|uniref:hypothetical protein n=1 Tax=Amycolatopsis sp. NPDC088138 TaxID=3363938 RepID=UPI00380EC8D3